MCINQVFLRFSFMDVNSLIKKGTRMMQIIWIITDILDAIKKLVPIKNVLKH